VLRPDSFGGNGRERRRYRTRSSSDGVQPSNSVCRAKQRPLECCQASIVWDRRSSCMLSVGPGRYRSRFCNQSQPNGLRRAPKIARDRNGRVGIPGQPVGVANEISVAHSASCGWAAPSEPEARRGDIGFTCDDRCLRIMSLASRASFRFVHGLITSRPSSHYVEAPSVQNPER